MQSSRRGRRASSWPSACSRRTRTSSEALLGEGSEWWNLVIISVGGGACRGPQDVDDVGPSLLSEAVGRRRSLGGGKAHLCLHPVTNCHHIRACSATSAKQRGSAPTSISRLLQCRSPKFLEALTRMLMSSVMSKPSVDKSSILHVAEPLRKASLKYLFSTIHTVLVLLGH